MFFVVFWMVFPFQIDFPKAVVKMIIYNHRETHLLVRSAVLFVAALLNWSGKGQALILEFTGKGEGRSGGVGGEEGTNKANWSHYTQRFCFEKWNLMLNIAWYQHERKTKEPIAYST